MQFVDRQLTCMDCSQPFIFTAGEQEFYDRKGFKEEPKRCKNCRDVRKTRRTGDFMSGVEGGGGGGGRGNGNGNHTARHGSDVDDNIGNRAPSTAASMATPSMSTPRGPREVRDVGELRGRGAREMFDATCAQCGAQTRVPFKPVAGRPVYCRDCYGSKRGTGN
jgi:CxxC-x17-CxxC domain-containing protein